MSYSVSSLLIMLFWNLQNVGGCLPFSILFLLMASILFSSPILLIITYQNVWSFFLLSLWKLSMCHFLAGMYSLFVAPAMFWLLDKARHTMSLSTIKNVLAYKYHYLSLRQMSYLSLMPHFWPWPSIFDAWYLIFISFWVHLTLWKLLLSSSSMLLFYSSQVHQQNQLWLMQRLTFWHQRLIWKF